MAFFQLKNNMATSIWTSQHRYWGLKLSRKKISISGMAQLMKFSSGICRVGKFLSFRCMMNRLKLRPIYFCADLKYPLPRFANVLKRRREH